MAKIINSSVYGGEDSEGKPVKLADEEKHSIGRPMWLWVTRIIYPSLIIPSLLVGFFTGRSCSEPVTPVAPQEAYKEGTPVQQKGITLGPEQAVRNNVIENHGRINVSISAPNPASMSPPSPEAKVPETEKRRIYQGYIPLVQ